MRPLPLTLSLLLLAAPALAVDTRPALSDREKMQRFMELNNLVRQHFVDKKYAEAETCCRQQLALFPNRNEARYNLACALSRQGNKPQALEALAKAVENGYNNLDHMQADDDLTPIREDKAYIDLVKKIEASGAPAIRADANQHIVEAAPASGLAYRLRLPKTATRDKPVRLIVWLHPSGGSMNDAAEKLAPRLLGLDYGLMVFTRKSFAGWSDQDAGALTRSLKAAGQVEGVDANKPVLMGFSAGGQMALSLWQNDPNSIGGMVLDAAYPVQRDPNTGQFSATPLPKHDGIKAVPILVVVGGKDGGAKLWKSLEDKWRQGGVPLVVRYVEGRGHEWLVAGKELTALEDWLKQVARGELPGRTAEAASKPAANTAE
jgi:predicted esterase